MTLFPSDVIANINISWLKQKHFRIIVVVGSKCMVIFDNVSESKITIYEKGIDRRAVVGENMHYHATGSFAIHYRSGDILILSSNTR